MAAAAAAAAAADCWEGLGKKWKNLVNYIIFSFIATTDTTSNKLCVTTFSRSQGTIHINRLSLNLQKKVPIISVSAPELGLHVALDGYEGDVVGPDEEVHFGLDHCSTGCPNGTGTGATG